MYASTRRGKNECSRVLAGEIAIGILLIRVRLLPGLALLNERTAAEIRGPVDFLGGENIKYAGAKLRGRRREINKMTAAQGSLVDMRIWCRPSRDDSGAVQGTDR